MATKVVIRVPHKGCCLALVFSDCALRASGFMPEAEAEAVLVISKISDLYKLVPVYKDCVAVNHKANNRSVLNMLRKFNIPQTAL